MGESTMTEHKSIDRSVEEDTFTCPVCGGTGPRQAIWNHLHYDHGWDPDRIGTALESERNQSEG